MFLQVLKEEPEHHNHAAKSRSSSCHSSYESKSLAQECYERWSSIALSSEHQSSCFARGLQGCLHAWHLLKVQRRTAVLHVVMQSCLSDWYYFVRKTCISSISCCTSSHPTNDRLGSSKPWSIPGGSPRTEIPLARWGKSPDRALYIFGPEDGSLDKDIRDWCEDVVYIPTTGCMNLAATVNVVLYDRLAKGNNTRSGPKF
jgi:hypothetical protein